MTKSELATIVAEKKKLPLSQAEVIVNRLFETIQEALLRGDKMEIRGFGSFTVRSYEGYLGRNPRTGETVAVSPKKLPFFKVGKELQERVNARRGDPESGA